MLEDLEVKVGPQLYLYNEGAINEIPKVLAEYRAKRILVVHGTISWEKAQPRMHFLTNSDYTFIYHQYSGECSYQETDNVVKIARKNNIDFIIGVGGGKLSDLVGYSAHILNMNFGLIPTLASSCAPWTPLSVMYKESGESEGKTEHYLRQAAFLITEPSLIIDSPVDYFIAGLADTIAKWYESDLILAQDKYVNEPFLQMARHTARLCKNQIFENATIAIESMKRKEVTEEFKQLSEIIFAAAGLVGGLGAKYARNAAAHAMHDAISKYIPECNKYLHGEKVAYGILYQLALEQDWQTIDELIPFYESLELPISLHQMGIYPEDETIFDDIVDFMDSKEKIHLIPIETSKDTLRQAITAQENYLNKKM